jgi:hypothetical protein
MTPPAEPARRVPTLLPEDVVRAPSGEPAVLVVRTGRGWTVLRAEVGTPWSAPSGGVGGGSEAITLVEAMSLADLVATELGVTPEPDRQARRAARNGPETHSGAEPQDPGTSDPRDAEITGLRRTVRQLEHALAARVSIERAIGVLAERHGTSPREAFEELRRAARAQGRPAQELAAEVLDALSARPVPDQRSGRSQHGATGVSTPGHRLPGGDPLGRGRAPRDGQGASGSGTVPGARS